MIFSFSLTLVSHKRLSFLLSLLFCFGFHRQVLSSDCLLMLHFLVLGVGIDAIDIGSVWPIGRSDVHIEYAAVSRTDTEPTSINSLRHPFPLNPKTTCFQWYEPFLQPTEHTPSELWIEPIQSCRWIHRLIRQYRICCSFE